MRQADLRQPLRARRRAKPLAPSKEKGTTKRRFCGKIVSLSGVQRGSYVSKKRKEPVPDGDMCAECKVLHAPFRAKLDWNGFTCCARTPDGTKYHDKMYGHVRKLAGDQEMASFIFGETRPCQFCRDHPKRLRRRRPMS